MMTAAGWDWPAHQTNTHGNDIIPRSRRQRARLTTLDSVQLTTHIICNEEQSMKCFAVEKKVPDPIALCALSLIKRAYARPHARRCTKSLSQSAFVNYYYYELECPHTSSPLRGVCAPCVRLRDERVCVHRRTSAGPAENAQFGPARWIGEIGGWVYVCEMFAFGLVERDSSASKQTHHIIQIV